MRRDPGPRLRRWWALRTALLVIIGLAGLAAGCGDALKSEPGSATTFRSSPGFTSTGVSAANDDGDDVNGPGAPTIDGGPARAGSGHQPGSAGCRSGAALANVYHPNRLTLVASCLTVSGIVETVRSEEDGDTHFDVALDPQFAHLLRPANASIQHGWLVAEIVPADKPGCTPGRPPRPSRGTYDYGRCTGADEPNPPIGSHVWVTGPYVLDQAHEGWAEIHPVWAWSTQPPPASWPNASQPTAAGPSTSSSAPGGLQPGVRILSVTSPVRRGSEAALEAQAAPGQGCGLAVTLPSGAQSQSQGLGPETADASGRLQWSWRTGTRTTPGTATGTVTCGQSSTSASFQITSRQRAGVHAPRRWASDHGLDAKAPGGGPIEVG